MSENELATVAMTADRAAETLRGLIKQRPSFEPGTVVRFVVRPKREAYDAVRYYTYAALFVNDQWYLTGSGNGFSLRMTTEDFVSALGASTVFDVEVATGWVSI